MPQTQSIKCCKSTDNITAARLEVYNRSESAARLKTPFVWEEDIAIREESG